MSYGSEILWDKGVLLKQFDSHRQFFRPASSAVVRRYMGRYVKPEDRLFELGSGLGELANELVPEYGDRIQQTEQSEDTIAENKGMHPDSNIVHADAYDLRKFHGKYDVGVMFSVLDALGSLKSPLEELAKVFPGGILIQFLDLQPSCHVVYCQSNTPWDVLFPLFEKDKIDGQMRGTGFQKVLEQHLSQLKPYFVERMQTHMDSLGTPWSVEDSRSGFDSYVHNAYESFMMCYRDIMNRGFLRMMSEWVQSSGVPTHPIRFNEHFRKRLKKGLLECGYTILQNGKRKGNVILDRTGVYAEHPDINVFHGDVGINRSRHDPELEVTLGEDKVKVISELYVVVAKAPE